MNRKSYEKAKEYMHIYRNRHGDEFVKRLLVPFNLLIRFQKNFAGMLSDFQSRSCCIHVNKTEEKDKEFMEYISIKNIIYLKMNLI